MAGLLTKATTLESNRITSILRYACISAMVVLATLAVFTTLGAFNVTYVKAFSGTCAYKLGRAVRSHPALALACYHKAADLGDARAMNSIGYAYTEGQGVPHDDTQALVWYRKAADHGDVWALTNIGIAYSNGDGVPRDDTQAMTWYRKAADLGDAEAISAIGYAYSNGVGVPRDDTQALTWYRKAADLGDASAMTYLEAAAHAMRIVTKDQAYVTVLKEPSEYDLVENYSDGYNSEIQEIEAKVASIADQNLRDTVRTSDLAGVDKAKFREQADAKFLQTRLAVLQRHQNDWFEIGHLEYSVSNNTLYIHGVDASPVTLGGAATMAMDVGSMDQIYSKFRNAAHDGIEAEALYQRSGWDENGHFGVETDPQMVAKIEKAAEATVRDKRLVMVGQGDLVAHRLDKLMLVDYDTEIVLAEFPPTSLHTDDFKWRFDTKTAEGY
jgi:Sel1 repeat